MDIKFKGREMKLYVVHYTHGGYAREDSDVSAIAGVYTDESVAKKVKLAVSGTISEVELDLIQPGYLAHLRALGFDI